MTKSQVALSSDAPADHSVTLSGGSCSFNDENLFGQVRASLASRHLDRELVLSIPIWGWTGDGKTVALLTALYSLEVLKHGLGLALISNVSALQKMESESATYRGMNLVATAESGRERITPLFERFVEGGDWPPGTDEGVSYLFDLRTVRGTVGYLFMPDLRGGSYREVDSQAREVLRTAHAAIVLVNPEQFGAKTAEGKRYRDAVVGQIQESALLMIPTAVLITQSDKYLSAGSAADEAHKILTVMLEQHREFPNCIARVSIIGKPLDDQGRLPPVADRDPESLLRPIVWLLWQALLQPKEAIHSAIPPLSLQPNEVSDSTKGQVALPELRVGNKYSNATGFALTSTILDSRSIAFIFLNEQGTLFETIVSPSGDLEPRSSNAGHLVNFDSDPTGIDGYLHSGMLSIGPRTAANWIWHGTKGSTLPRTSLPSTLATWVPTTGGFIVGIDSSGAGRLCSLRLTNGKWVQVDHIGEFIAQNKSTVVGYLPQRSTIIAMNGERVEAITFRADGCFGDRVSAPFSLRFDSEIARLNSIGVAVALKSTGQLAIATRDKPLEISAVVENTPVSFALASSAPVIAAILADHRLVAARVTASGLLLSEYSYSPILDDEPKSLCWSPDGRILVATFDAGEWCTYRPFGLGV